MGLAGLHCPGPTAQILGPILREPENPVPFRPIDWVLTAARTLPSHGLQAQERNLVHTVSRRLNPCPDMPATVCYENSFSLHMSMALGLFPRLPCHG